MTQHDDDARRAAATFEDEVARPPRGLLREFGAFLRHNKKWWLTPILVVLLLLGLLIVLGGTAFAPFIYPFW